MDNIGLQTPSANLSPPPPPTPVPVEQPQIIRPQRKKKGLKILGGMLAVILLVGGLVLGKNLLQEQQRPVEKMAEELGTCTGSWTCTCTGGYCADHGDSGKSYTYGCERFVGQQLCTGGNDGQGNYCNTIDGWTRSDGCSWKENGGGDEGTCSSDVSNTCVGPVCEGKSDGQYVLYEGSCFKCTINKGVKGNDGLYCCWTNSVGEVRCGGGANNCTKDNADSCRLWYCPKRDTNGDGNCTNADQGGYLAESGSCTGMDLGNNCGQLDYIKDGNNCGWEKNLGDSCSTTNFFMKCTENKTCESRLCQSGSCDNQCQTDTDCQESAPSPSPSQTCTIQGYKVTYPPENASTGPFTDNTVTVGNQGSLPDNPYFFKNLVLGQSYGVSVNEEPGYSVGYTVCYNSIDCHTASPSLGASKTVVCPNATAPGLDIGYVDLWWHFQPMAMSCVSLTKNIDIPNQDDQVTFTCEANVSAAAPQAFFRYQIDGGQFNEDPNPYPITANKASKIETLSIPGNWTYQCKVCTDAAATSCTAWGQAQ